MPTYDLIASSNVTSAVNNITFTSIPQTYTDLVLHYSAIQLDNASGINSASFYVQISGITSGGIYASRVLRRTPGGTITGAGSGGQNTGELTWSADSLSNTYGTSGYLSIFNYTTSQYKGGIGMAGNAPQANGVDGVEMWLAQTSTAVTSLNFYPQRNNFITNTKVYLYGIKAA